MLATLQTRQANPFYKTSHTQRCSCQDKLCHISQNRYKKSKPFSDGEFIKECMVDSAALICPEKKGTFENVPLFRHTVMRRVEDIVGNLELQLRNRVVNFYHFSLALDENCDLSEHQPRLLRKRVPLLKELMFLVPEQSAATQTKRPVSTADRRTVESSPVCSQIIEDCGKDENLSSSETTSYSVPHRAEASHGAVHLSVSLMKLFFFVYCQAFKMFF
ncbi:uncharacterized protein LOC131368917 isoform X2 [Hemibagrus wyckioides]|uniref:uncharacterized protein LOC131368917 isoform X2 n=1 Tax=Hemibagrus wyckioides TaxID=337641 RepID=UPI00266D7251|nr:uncharacterized protein LOC131368917 isoform X2 [Hemibagrus wyckioides]